MAEDLKNEEIKYDGELLLEDIYAPVLSKADGEQLKEIQKRFMKSYLANRDKMEVEQWLNQELAAELPDYRPNDIKEMSSEIIRTLKVNEEKQKSLNTALKKGRSQENWLAEELESATAHMTAQETVRYLQGLDDTLVSANEAFRDTLTTKAGLIKQNPNLDGFIAEQHHAQTFNLNAKAQGSPYRAKVLDPGKGGYHKNSVDLVIVDANGKIVKRYQSKYYQNAQKTEEAFGGRRYPWQSKLAPSDQVSEIRGKALDVIESPDGITSNPLPKSTAKQLQEEAQSGNWQDWNWNQYKTKDLAIGVSKQAGQAALMGAAVGTGFHVAQKVWNGEEIDGGEVIEAALTSGADFGMRAAATGALKVGVEKELIRAIPKGTPASTLANIVSVAVENAKVVGQIAEGKLSVRAGLDRMAQVSVATIAGIAAGAKSGAALGAAVGTVFGPAGTVVGGFVGGALGYMAGSKVGETLVKGWQKVRNKAAEMGAALINNVGKTIKKWNPLNRLRKTFV